MTHETVRAMIERGAKIRWFCEVGQGHYGEVNLKAIARAKGGTVTLINRRPLCKIPGCPGRSIFRTSPRHGPRSWTTSGPKPCSPIPRLSGRASYRWATAWSTDAGAGQKRQKARPPKRAGFIDAM